MAARYALAICKLIICWRPATPTIRTPLRKPESYLDWVCVSVVVVVTGAGTVVCCVVVVELCVVLSVPQPVTDMRATAATQGRISFVICIISFGFCLAYYFTSPKLRNRLVIGYGV